MTQDPPIPAAPRWLTPARLDRGEQVAIVILWALLVWRVFAAGNALAPLVLIAETTVMVFVLIRRPTENISLKLSDWFLAIVATGAPLLIQISDTPAAMKFAVPVAVVLFLIGNIIQISGKLFLRRSFGIAPANRGIKTDGLYRLVRHPIYAGYLLVHIATLLLMPSPINFLIYAIGWTAQIMRLLAEERLLSQDPAYCAFTAKTRWRLIPGIF